MNRVLYGLVALSLATSAIHFADNALRLDRYPGPAWFTPAGVAFAWLGLPALAWLALRGKSFALMLLFSLTGFLGFEHYLVRPLCSVDWSCNLTIFCEAAASALLFGYVLIGRLRRNTFAPF